MSRILTEQINPPIPTTAFDWRAVFDGYEPGDPIGYGRSEQDAVADLIANLHSLMWENDE